MLRIIPYLTLPLTIFVFISIILINVGGIDIGSPNADLTETFERHGEFNLIKWNYTITPVQKYASYSNHLFLNRYCWFSQYTAESPGLSDKFGFCRNSRIKELNDGESLQAQNYLVGQISPFRFDTVYLNVPFAFYVMTAIFCVLLMLMGVGGGGKRLGRVVGWVGTLISGLALAFIVIASAVLTIQMTHLRDQIREDTIRVTTLRSNELGSSPGDTTDYTTTVNGVTLGKVVLGLTWASVAAVFIECLMWGYSALRISRERVLPVEKEEKYVQG